MWRPLLDDLVPPPRWPELGWRLYIAIALLLIFLPPLACQARAQARTVFSAEECVVYARGARSSAEIRDIGADLELHLQLLRRRLKTDYGAELTTLFERETRLVYARGLPPDQAELDAYRRCMSNEIFAERG